jgi:predicted ATPase with chaperone activity
VRIVRPTIVMGGELELANFDIAANRVTGIHEAPLQLKANCGTLVIDDFGRNRFRPSELLNRLVIPMERGIDSFHLASGRTFHVPFECMLVLASNDVPADIVDEAFLRRIPFKIAVNDPSEEQFKQLYLREAQRCNVQTSEDDAEYLLQRHYRASQQPRRFCHPRDLMRMIANSLQFHGQPPVVTHEAIDRAVEAYVSLKTGSPAR